jgi:radical SAM superfamily enzyme YgiQ (UPF0313 family)
MIDKFPFLTPKKILLIEPPFYRFFNYERWYYPLTLTLVGTYLEKLGHDVSIYDADKPTTNCSSLDRSEIRKNYYKYKDALENSMHPIWKEVFEKIEKSKADVIGITSITAKIDSANKIAKYAKEYFNDKIRIILGGPHVQGMSLIYKDYNFGKYYDEIVQHIPNLVDQTPNKSLIVDVERYKPEFLSSMITEAGCPMNCTFCARSYDRKIIYRNLASIYKELTQIKNDYGGSVPVSLADDCFLSNTTRFNEISGYFKELDLKYIGGSRIMALTQEKIERYISTGGIRIHVGVESGSQTVLRRIKKMLNIVEIKKRTKWLNDVKIPWQAFIIVGFPFEVLEDLKKTEDLLYEIQPTYVSINRFTPYPGTEIYREFFMNEKIEFKDLFQINSGSCIKLPKENEEFINQMYEKFDRYNENNKKKISMGRQGN